jgi:hypothetical protein
VRRGNGIYLSYKQPSGALREDPTGFNGSACGHHPPVSNAEYGTKESTLSQSKLDPVADMIYSSNFGMLGLHEAAAAVGSGADHALYNSAAGEMANFALRVQVASGGDGISNTTDHFLAGTWLRAFDFKAWEHFAFGSDNGWGAWVAEAGHGHSLIMMVLAARAHNTSLWDVIVRRPWSDALKSTVLKLIPAFLDGQ